MKYLTCSLGMLIICLVSGCDRLTSPPPSDSFQFISTPSGDSFIFHAKTGKIVRITSDGLDTLTETTKVLQVGEYYQLDDGGDQPYVKYLGGGKFEPSKWAIRKKSD